MLPLCMSSTSVAASQKDSAAEVSASYAQTLSSSTGSTAGKEETVYVSADPDGAPSSVVVSEWLKNPDKAATLQDSSNLSNIQNVSGDETYNSGADGALTWNANGNDIYYQGTSDAELPVGVSVRYQLDGRDVGADELAGASGKLTMTFTYSNRLSKTVSGSSGSYTVYQPFAAVTLFYLDNDVAQNVTVSSGKVIDDGGKNIVIGYAMPGLAESLGLEDDANLPDSVTVTADVQDFKLLMTLTVADNSLLDNIDVENIDSLKTLESSLNDMAANVAKLYGSAQTQDAGQTGLAALRSDADTLNKGVSALTDGVSDLKDGAQSLTDGASDLNDGADKLKSGAQDVNSGAQSLADGANTLSDGIADVYSGSESLQSGLSALSANSSSLNSGAASVADAVFAAATQQLQAKLIATGMTQQEAESIVLTRSSYLTVLAQLSGGTPTDGQTAAAVSTIRSNLAAAGVTDSDVQDFAMTLADQALSAGTAGTVENSLNYACGLLSDAAAVQTAVGTYSTTPAAAGLVSVLTADPYDMDATTAMAVACTALSMDSANPAGQIQSAAAKVQNAGIVSASAPDADKISSLGRAAASAAIIASASKFSALKDQLDSVMTFLSGLASYTSGVDSAASGAATLTDGVGSAADGAAKLASGASALTEGTKALSDGAGSMQSGTSTLAQGTSALYDGTTKLYDGTVTLQQGLSKLMDNENDLADILERLEAVQNFASEYKSYGGCIQGTECSVKFIVETGEIGT